MNSLSKFLPKSSFFRSASIYFLSNVISAVIPFLLLPILTRYLTPEEYGEIALFQVLVGFFSAFVGVNVNGAIVRYYYEKSTSQNNDISNYIGVCFLILLVSMLIALLSMFVFSGYISESIKINESYIYIALLVSAFSFLIKIRLSQYQVRKLPLKYAFIQIPNAALSVLITLLLIIGFSLGPNGRVYAMLVSAVFISFVCVYLLIKERVVSFRNLKKEYFFDALNYGVKIIPHILGVFLIGIIDRYIIASKIGLNEVGVYMSAIQLGLILSVLFDGINKAFVPWLFSILKRDIASEKNKVVRFTYGYIILLVSMMPFFYYLSPLVVNTVLGKDFSDAADIIGLILIAQCLSGIYLMFTNYIIYEKKTGRLSLITITCGGVHVALSLFLLEENGIYGVAISLVITMFIRAISTFYISSKYSNIKWY